ncbi:MAG: LysR family transcriptional regulator [Marinobacter sp.]|uniref:LysR family transcriptional regulator n=1 Tax=Marinobacter sp. TaxID=50741 RepID=UPI0034A03E81
MDWDYLRYIHALASGGTLARAGDILGVHQTTVLRRLDQMEEQLGVQLFERTRDGVQLTAVGETAFNEAERMRQDMDSLERKLMGQDARPAGKVRLATTDTLLSCLINPILSEFVAVYPGIQLEVTTGNEVLSLSRRDTDIALRPTNEPQETLIGRRIGVIESAIYASADYINDHPPFDPENPEAEAWVVPDDSFSHLATNRWYRKHLKDTQPVIRCNSLYGMYSMICSGTGVGVIPCYMGDSAPGLKQLSPPLEGEGTDLWLLTHQDLRQMARVRMVLEFLADKLRELQPLLEGRVREGH